MSIKEGEVLHSTFLVILSEAERFLGLGSWGKPTRNYLLDFSATVEMTSIGDLLKK